MLSLKRSQYINYLGCFSFNDDDDDDDDDDFIDPSLV
jgi:hypothetical protein